MIDETIKTALKQRHGKLNFNDLVTFIENSGITFKDRCLNGPLGIATLDCIYLNIELIDKYSDKLVFFIIVHEVAHFKRITKFGRSEILRKLSFEDFKEFTEHIFEEEIIADRYACMMFYHFNRDIYPWWQTQQLNLKVKQKEYEPMTRLYYGKIQNDEKKYNELIEQFIKY